MSINTRHFDKNQMFVQSLEQAEIFDFNDGKHPTHITITTGEPIALDAVASHYIVVHDGEFFVTIDGSTHRLGAGFFGCFPGSSELKGDGQALILSNFGYRCTTLSGGPVEEFGRLRYVDGCTATLLLSPAVRGDPCLNFMHLPRHVSQTMHTHPSLRAGVILSGNGKCATDEGVLDFRPGTAFFIPPNVQHSFQSQDETLRIVIYHPDSDSGPTHTDHTMLNRTYVGGKSAQHLTNLHTRLETQQ